MYLGWPCFPLYFIALQILVSKPMKRSVLDNGKLSMQKLKFFGRTKASRDRLLSTDHPFFWGEPYFSKSVVDAILTLSMRAGTLETTLHDLPETKAAVLFKGRNFVLHTSWHPFSIVPLTSTGGAFHLDIWWSQASVLESNTVVSV